MRGGNPLSHRTPTGSNLVHGRPAVGFTNHVGNTFRPDLRRVHATRRYRAVVTCSECFRFVVPGHRDLAAQHHDAHVDIMCVQVLGKAALLATMHDLEAFATQVALESLTRQRPTVTTAAGDV